MVDDHVRGFRTGEASRTLVDQQDHGDLRSGGQRYPVLATTSSTIQVVSDRWCRAVSDFTAEGPLST